MGGGEKRVSYLLYLVREETLRRYCFSGASPISYYPLFPMQLHRVPLINSIDPKLFIE